MAWDEDDDGVEHCLAHIEPHLPESGLVVDIGSGVGRLAFPLAERHPVLAVYGYDTSLEMIHHAPTRPNLGYGSFMPARFRFAYSVVTFQHITDAEVQEYLRACVKAEAPIVFQFVAGTEREPLSMQREPRQVRAWCHGAGFAEVDMWHDDRFDNWRWVHAR